MLYLVRHAKAGDRAGWSGDDRDRPLTRNGVAQAEALADRYAPLRPPRLLSSPYVRCVQTLEPLAARCGLEVEPLESLAEGRPFEPVLELMAGLPDATVLCSHGDLIPDLVAAMARRGAALVGPAQWKKGSAWRVTMTDGRPTRLEAEPPP